MATASGPKVDLTAIIKEEDARVDDVVNNFKQAVVAKEKTHLQYVTLHSNAQYVTVSLPVEENTELGLHILSKKFHYAAGAIGDHAPEGKSENGKQKFVLFATDKVSAEEVKEYITDKIIGKDSKGNDLKKNEFKDDIKKELQEQRQKHSSIITSHGMDLADAGITTGTGYGNPGLNNAVKTNELG